ncbi:hypothetical protein E4U40_001686 [Claviceps sp. LM458 group G5]|nr:hypothetical protein E4U40_001686 [Claviceps sp. LM458 group G5]
MRAFSLLTLLLPYVAANTHRQCDCWTWSSGGSWIQNADLTHYICLKYPDHTYYDTKSQRCKTDDGYVIDGQIWEDDCKSYGEKQGYSPFTTDGRLDTNHALIKVGAAVGSCPNRD